MDVRQALLNDPEDGKLGVTWKTIKVWRDFQLYLDLAALRKAIHVPSERGGQTSDFQKGRVKKMREGTNFAGNLIHKLSVL